MACSVFADQRKNVYVSYAAELLVSHLVGGCPSDPRVAEGWLKKNLGADNEDLIREMVAKTMVERGVEFDDAFDEVAKGTKLNGFKRDPEHGLYIEGRHAKAMLKEAANVSWPKRSWGPSRKGTRSYWAELVQVDDDRIYLGVDKPTAIQQRFVSTFRGQGIQYEEYVVDAVVALTVSVDVNASKEISVDDWTELWIRAESLGIGATRSQGFGKFVVTRWEQL